MKIDSILPHGVLHRVALVHHHLKSVIFGRYFDRDLGIWSHFLRTGFCIFFPLHVMYCTSTVFGWAEWSPRDSCIVHSVPINNRAFTNQ